MGPNSWKKVETRALKWDFNKNLIYSFLFSCWICKHHWPSTSAKIACLRKISFSSYDQKTSWINRMQDSLNWNISWMNWGMKLKFFMLLDIRKNKLTQSFQLGMVRQPWIYPKWYKMKSQLNLWNVLRNKVGLWPVVRHL